jgi:16S rRNA (adenine1518-N6/adenine1519-N6)-dimethyltransferase
VKKSELKMILESIGLVPRKRLGQNFLASEKVAERIVNAASLTKEDLVIEVGPGLGVVTEKILEKGAAVLAVEIDKKLSSYLSERFLSCKNFHLIEEDFLHVEPHTILSFNGTHTMKFISNLPYRGAKKMIKKLSGMNLFTRMVITIQKEVADVLIKKPGSPSAQGITYSSQYFFKIEKLFDIPYNFFYPSPKVNSTTLLFSRRNTKIKTENRSFYLISVDLLLKNRRKKLKNKMKSIFHLSEESTNEILHHCRIAENSRATDLHLEQMIELSNCLYREGFTGKTHKDFFTFEIGN